MNSDTTHLRWLQSSPGATAQVLKVCGRKAEVLQVSFGPFRFDPQNGLWRGTREVPLPPRAVGVLAALVAQAGTTVSKQTLLDTCWRDTFVTEASLLEPIRLLRRALDDDRLNPTYIQTVHRRGYRFIAEVRAVARPLARVQDRDDGPSAADPWRPPGSHQRVSPCRNHQRCHCLCAVRPVGEVDVTPTLRQVALSAKGDAGQDVWIGDLERGAWSRLPAAGQSISPTWRPDGLAIAFAYSKTGPFNLFVRPADATGALEALIDSPWNQFPTSWSADGRLLAFTEYHPVTGADVWLLDVRTRERRAFVRTLFDESHARFSPDGRWLAYISNEAGRWEVFLRRSDGSGARQQVSPSGGAWPCWSVDGQTLYFSVGGRTAAVAIQTSPELRASAPVLISSRADLQLASGRADRGRVLVRDSIDALPRQELRVVLEWFAELTRLVRMPV